MITMNVRSLQLRKGEALLNKTIHMTVLMLSNNKMLKIISQMYLIISITKSSLEDLNIGILKVTTKSHLS
jgi:hypothetical protein